jgi:hypothetical protein
MLFNFVRKLNSLTLKMFYKVQKYSLTTIKSKDLLFKSLTFNFNYDIH